MESRKGSRPQVRQTALPQYSRTRRRVSPSWGGAFLLRKLTGEGRVKWRRGALPPPRRLRSLSCAARSRSPPGGEGRLPGVFPGRTIPGSPVSETRWACGKTYQFGFVFGLLFVGGPVPRASLVAPAPAEFLAATAAASGSRRRRRPELLHLSLALSPAAQKPQVSSRANTPRSTQNVPRPRTERVARQAPLPGHRVSPSPGNPDANTPVPPLSAGASPAPKQLQSPRSPPPSGRRLGWRKSRCLSL